MREDAETDPIIIDFPLPRNVYSKESKRAQWQQEGRREGWRRGCMGLSLWGALSMPVGWVMEAG